MAWVGGREYDARNDQVAAAEGEAITREEIIVLKPAFGNRSPGIALRGLALAALVTPMVSGAASPAYACSCVQRQTPASYVERAGVIFEGVPAKIELLHPPGAPRGLNWQGATVRSTIRVVKIFKGTPPTEIIIESRLGESLCGWQPYGVGRPQIFAASKSDGRYTTDFCAMYPLSRRLPNNPYLKYIRALKSRSPE